MSSENVPESPVVNLSQTFEPERSLEELSDSPETVDFPDLDIPRAEPQEQLNQSVVNDESPEINLSPTSESERPPEEHSDSPDLGTPRAEPQEQLQQSVVSDELTVTNLSDITEPEWPSDEHSKTQPEEPLSESISVESEHALETEPSSFQADEQLPGSEHYDEELSLSKGQQVMYSGGELFDPDEVMQELSDLILKTELGDKDAEPEEEYIEPAKKNRRVQVPSTDITKGISKIEPSPKKKPKKRVHDPTPQKIGVLVGIPCRRRSSKGASTEDRQLELLKHFSLVFLSSRLKNPKKWSTETFAKIRSLGDSTASELVKTKFPVICDEKTYCMTLTGTIAKGRVNSPTNSVSTFRDSLIEHVSSHSGLVLKCESDYVLTWKVSDGYYLYEPCLNDSSQLLFFNSLRMMTEFVVDTKKLNNKSKYYLSKIWLSSIDDGHIVTLKRKSHKAKMFEVLNRNEAILMGDRYLKEASFMLESLRISLNAISLAQDVEARSWNASDLNDLFDGKFSERVINKLGVFLCEEGSEDQYLLEEFRMMRLNVAFSYADRESLELLMNRLLAIREALILKVDESYFAVWSSGDIVYWFSPFRYDALELDPGDLDDKAGFLFASNSLPRLSSIMFDYFTERRLLPKHTIHLFSVDAEPFGKLPRITVVDSTDSLNQSELEIHVEQDDHATAFISDEDLPGTTWSQAKLCRLMLREVIGRTEENISD